MQTDLTFLDRVPTLTLREPLAEFLGALRPGGTIRYGYEDAVKLAGHSCPTVARAYLMTGVALRALYPGELPVRGELEVTIGGEAGDGHTGPASQVVGLLTGAARETGFGGLAGRFRRQGLLSFDPALKGAMRFRRTDTGAAVEVTFDRAGIPASPEFGPLMSAAVGGSATSEELRRFGELWQARVEAMLTTDPARITQVRKLAP